ncbi:hypothetical protein ASPNIDRAFT_54669 [Aspergillus niger ATCC 1015]|uniref:Uncharacterized protein n=1 Tax=Aspergillus niger (strain ATCC 1015 / CBS 113.46 / FGSC A1144 / LSHB Ac4 / NCTC 3858a / NRRL 328 / USDA 3528.7) TaxID=380704 RepID=G3Y9V3_ASPNA|nr:hypothetical protein ASPNIDRAFT_54669 [Aspergillus niger ATCC 1015]
MATARLRRAFRYPDDSGDEEHSREELDEEAYIMKYLPLERPDPKGKRPMATPHAMASIRPYILPVNAAICVLLALVYASQPTTQSWLEIQPVIYLVPGAMFAAVLVARKVMLSVDLKTLENLRYEYKGA